MSLSSSVGTACAVPWPLLTIEREEQGKSTSRDQGVGKDRNQPGKLTAEEAVPQNDGLSLGPRRQCGDGMGWAGFSGLPLVF